MRSANQSNEHSDDDDAFLDEVLDLALQRCATGEALDLDALIVGRGNLRVQVASLLEMARDIAPVTAPRLPGQRLPIVPGFTIEAEVGRGGMGIVYRARQETLGRTVAVKVLAPGLMTSVRARARFVREARALARLHHPHVVVVHDVLETDDLCAYVMEWVEGTTLARALAAPDAHLDAREVGRIGASLAEALATVHAAGLVHRDVKPSNVLLRHDGAPLLSDFGLVRDSENSLHTAEGQFVGTAAYAAPEQLRGDKADVGPRSDIYSLGATLYHALAGSAPFPACSTTELLRRVARAEYTPLLDANPHVPADLAAVVGKAMEPEPSMRYATANDLAADLLRFVRGEPVLAGAPARHAATRPRGPRSRWVLPLLLLAVASIAGLIASLLAWQREHQARVAAQRHEYAARISAATSALAAGDPTSARELLDGAPAPGAFEWRYLRQRAEQKPGDQPEERTVPGTEHGCLLLDPLNRWLLHASATGAGSRVTLGHLAQRSVDVCTLLNDDVAWRRSLSASRDGTRVAISTRSGVAIFSGDDLATRAQHTSGPVPTPLRQVDTGSAPAAVFLAARARELVIVGLDGVVSRWNLPDATPAATLGAPQEGLLAAAMDPQGRQLAMATPTRVQVFELASARLLATLAPLTGVRAIAFRLDGHQLAVSHDAGAPKITLWDCAHWQPRVVLEGHQGAVSSLAFSHDGTRLASGSNDGVLRLWDPQAGTAVLTLHHPGTAASTVVWSADGTWLLSSSAARVWFRHAPRESGSR